MGFTINSVHIVGRITKDPDVRYLEGSGTTCARFSLALDRGKDREGNDLGADFPSCVAFGRTAEYVEKYIKRAICLRSRATLKQGPMKGTVSNGIQQTLLLTKCRTARRSAIRIRPDRAIRLKTCRQAFRG